jgi:5'-nucleotidase
VGEVTVVGPDREQSGTSHSLTLHRPLRPARRPDGSWQIDGTPTDCVMLAIQALMPERPDFVFSGVNHGPNMGEDVLYSGTVAGAKEAAVLGIPSFALSQAYTSASKQQPYWQTAIAHAPEIIHRVLKTGIPRDVLVNINFPDCPPGAVKGMAVAAQGKRDQQLLHIDARHDGRGNPYYWLAYGRGARPAGEGGTDLHALNDNRISITPLRLDLTDPSFLTKLAGVFP